MCKGKEMIKAIEQLLKSDKGFASALTKLKIISLENGDCKAEFKVDESMTNTFGTCHGAFYSLVADNITTFALMSHEKAGSGGVSLDLHTRYLKAAPMGLTIEVIARTVRAGRKVAFLEADFKNKETGELLAQAMHTKFTDL